MKERYNSKREPVNNLTINRNEMAKIVYNYPYKTLSLEGSLVKSGEVRV